MTDDVVADPLSDSETEGLFDGRMPIAEALEKLRLRLLDLTARNRLLNFKHSASKTLQFVEGRPAAAFERLVESSGRLPLQPVPQPSPSEFIQEQGRLARPDVRDYARQRSISVSFELPTSANGQKETAALRALLYPDELERHCRKLAREAKTAIEETGANMLFLLLGFLEYPEAPQASKMLLAPLVAIPVSMDRGDVDRGTGTYRYSLSYTGEELSENLSLREKLKGDFNLELPDFTEETSLAAYYAGVHDAIRGRPGFKLLNQATVALVSMTKMLLVRDLDPKNWPKQGRGSSLTEHEIVRMVFEGRREAGGNVSGEEYEVDSHELGELPLIFDADSSQHSALIDAVQGKNLVIEGPPGTGKSQTITNLVASAIADGKKVLFVAEKLAALQVVKSRLTQAGLADFCLELHSNKTSKKEVLESIGSRIEKRFTRPSQLEAMIEALRDKRKTLSAYVQLINSEAGNAQGLTVHEVLWKAERFRQKADPAWRSAQGIKVARAGELTRAEFETLYDQLARLGKEYERIGTFGPAAPLWGFFPRGLGPGAQVEIEAALDKAASAAMELAKRYEATAEILQSGQLALSREEARGLCGELSKLSAAATPDMAQELLPALFPEREPNGSLAERALERFAGFQHRAHELRNAFNGRLHEDLDAVHASQRTQGVFAALSAFGLDKWTTAEVAALAEKCRESTRSISDVMDGLAKVAAQAGVPFGGTDRCVASVMVPITLCAECPRDLLHLRNPQLAAPGAAETIRDAQRKFASIAKANGALSQVFYLDSSISEREVEEALFALREGDQWWRMLQSRQRAAIAVHRRLAKTKSMVRADRRQQLEELHSYLRDMRLATEDSRYKAAVGAQWRGADTEFERLYKVAAWIERCNAALADSGLESAAFSPNEVLTSVVSALAKLEERVAASKAALVESEELFSASGPLFGATTARRQFANAKSWAERAALLAEIADRLGTGAEALSAIAEPSQTLDVTAAALSAKSELAKIMEKASRDAEAKSMFGAHFAGIDTRLSPIRQAFEYGAAVINLQLPEPMRAVLLSAAGSTLRESLVASLRAMDDAWRPIDEFIDSLNVYGEVDLKLWAGCEASHADFIAGLSSRITHAKEGVAGLLHWAQYVDASTTARHGELRPFVELLESKAVSPDQIPDLFGYRFYGSIAEMLFERHRRLGRFSALSHQAIRDEFRKLDSQVIGLRGRDVAASAARLASPPTGTSGARVADKTELTLLEYLLPQSRPRLPIRKMMTAAGRAIQELKPCFMMGPQAVAQYLAPGTVKFDIVVMDEASQLKPEEALGAIARGGQLVVVGDPKQLPPTAFFDKLGETLDDDDSSQQIALMQESILDVCIGHFKPVRTLRWHYRSQHESLIAFSNARFYRNKLIVFPSAYGKSRNLGVRCRYVAGATYESQVNVAEANIVVDAVLKHMSERPGDSLGVVTLNLKQRELIEELLDRKIRDLEYAEQYCRVHEEGGYGFFVKNLENVQGDERDVIFVSTTFGPAPGTRAVYQRFGPISRHDGWRRLNVLFTRARKSLTVFTSMRPEDINDGDSVPRGTRELRAYLEYLRTNVVPADSADGTEPESDFEIAVMNSLERAGYGCKPQHGVAGFRIDIAVRHPSYPNAFLAAIECDGASYHSGRSARDRDRIRQAILESLGWKGRIFRVWSTDWYRAPGAETARLLQWLESLKAMPFDEAYITPDEDPFEFRASEETGEGSNAPEEGPTLKDIDVRIDDEVLEVQVGDTVTYKTLATGEEQTVLIGTASDPAKGMIGYRTPLAEALLGLQQGEMATMQPPGRPPVNLRVLEISRPTS